MKLLAFLSLSILLLLGQVARAQVDRENGDVRLENLNGAIVELRKAYAEKDLKKITSLINQPDIDSLGGAERFADLVGLGRSAGPETTATFRAPAELVSIEGRHFGVVPFRMQWIKENRLHIVETCLVGISLDDGETWRLKTGESFFRDYPEFMGRITIIERTTTVEEGTSLKN